MSIFNEQSIEKLTLKALEDAAREAVDAALRKINPWRSGERQDEAVLRMLHVRAQEMIKEPAVDEAIRTSVMSWIRFSARDQKMFDIALLLKERDEALRALNDWWSQLTNHGRRTVHDKWKERLHYPKDDDTHTHTPLKKRIELLHAALHAATESRIDDGQED